MWWCPVKVLLVDADPRAHWMNALVGGTPGPVVVVPGQGSWWATPGAMRLLAAEYAKFVAVWLRRRVGVVS